MNRIDLETLVGTLGRTSLLGSLPERELKEIANVGRQSRYAAGAAVYRKSMPGDHMFLLASGRAKITAAGPTGTELILELVDSGEMFGEIAAIDGGPRSANAIVTRDADVVAFDRRFLQPILYRNPSTAQALSESLCGYLRGAIGNLEKVALLDSQNRLWAKLLDLGRRYAAEDMAAGGVLRIEHGLSQQSLAESVGLTRVIVNRVLSRWREAGLIEHGRGFVLIPDVDRLAKAIEERTPEADHRVARSGSISDAE